MPERRQNNGIRCQIVHNFLSSITDDTVRMVCYMYSRGENDDAVCRKLKITRKRLVDIKLQLEFDLRKAGIQV